MCYILLQELPRVERELKNLLHSFEEKEGKYFLYNDERLLDVIDRQWNEWKNNKKTTSQTKVPCKFIKKMNIEIYKFKILFSLRY